MAPSVSGSSHSPSPRKHQTFCLLRVFDAAVLQILVEPGLVDGHDRPQAHRHRGKFPERGHQPGMRIARQAAFRLQLLAEVGELSSVSRPSRNAREYMPGEAWPWK